MSLMKRIFWFVLLLFPALFSAQNLDDRIHSILQELAQIQQREEALRADLETLKLQRIQRDLRAIGLPGQDYVMHAAMALEYAEDYEQARWVAHIITSDIIEGNVNRTNDFRPDPKVATGTADEADYFLKYEQADGSFEYDGYGYDRGHLAPSADFRWSERALSESYFYSNMSPQLPAFNREKWAELESILRGYIYRHPETQLYVVTGGLLEKDLPLQERSANGLRIPRRFFKVALDLKNQTAVGFILPHESIEYPLEHFAAAIDDVEAAAGLDFFANLPDDQETVLEQTFSIADWIPEMGAGDVSPVQAPTLARGHFNTVQAGIHAGSGHRLKVCGTVVSARYSRSGNLWLNIDKQFPNQIFSVFIRKEDLVNFRYVPDKELIRQPVCFHGVVEKMNGTPTMNIAGEEAVSFGIPRK